MRPLPVVDHRLGVLTAADLSVAGWSAAAVQRAVAAGRLDRVARGAYAPPVDAADPSHAAVTRARVAVAAALGQEQAYVSHLSAATVRGLPVWAPAERACVSLRGRRVASLVDLHVHRAGGADADFRERSGVRLTSTARTVCDIAREFGTESGLVTADAALRHVAVRRDDLVATAARCYGWPGARRLPDLLAHLDPTAESVLESRSRFALHRHALPPPATQVQLYATGGRFLGRVDFYWDDVGVVGEADGEGKYDGPAVLQRERRRERRLVEAGLVVERWGWADLAGFERTAARLRAAFALGARRDGPRGWVARPV